MNRRALRRRLVAFPMLRVRVQQQLPQRAPRVSGSQIHLDLAAIGARILDEERRLTRGHVVISFSSAVSHAFRARTNVTHSSFSISRTDGVIGHGAGSTATQ
jgi:hypothetical protein